MELSKEQKEFINKVNPEFDLRINSIEKDLLLGLLENTQEELLKRDMNDIMEYGTDILEMIEKLKGLKRVE